MLNDHQYQLTQSWVSKFEESLTILAQNKTKKEQDPDGWQLLQDSYKSQLDTLRSELAEYENLIDHNPNAPISLDITDINYLSDVLIKARIALKLTQSELAKLAGITRNQIIIYEEKDYQNASFIDVLAVSNALGIKINNGVVIAQLTDLTTIKESKPLYC